MTAIYYPFLRAKTFDVIAVSNLAQQNGTFPAIGVQLAVMPQGVEHRAQIVELRDLATRPSKRQRPPDHSRGLAWGLSPDSDEKGQAGSTSGAGEKST